MELMLLTVESLRSVGSYWKRLEEVVLGQGGLKTYGEFRRGFGKW
jgi:hypothetical protein